MDEPHRRASGRIAAAAKPARTRRAAPAPLATPTPPPPARADGLALAVLPAVLAGWVDAVGLARLGGVFVSFMSGNTTNIGVNLAHLDGDHATVAGVVVALFVVGVIVGEFAGPVAGRRRRGAVLLLVAVLLGTAAAVAAQGAAHGAGPMTLAGPMTVAGPMVLAMGAQSACVRWPGRAGSATTILVDLGRALAGGLRGQGFGDATARFSTWLGLVGGAALGAVSLRVVPAASLAGPAVLALALALVELVRPVE